MFRLSLAFLALVTCAPASATDYRQPVEELISGYIQPVTQSFAETAGQLPEAVRQVCSSYDTGSRDVFRTAYANTVRDFAKVHFLRYGPLIEEDRLSRLAFMPDPRGVAQRQIRKLLAEQDSDALDAHTLSGKSVAVQGLTAMQLIAFNKTGTVVLGKGGPDSFTCGYALAIARNVSAIAHETSSGWHDASGYSQELLAAGSEGARFKSPKEALETVFNVLATGVTVARDQNVLPALGASEEKAKPRRLPFSRSANGILFLSSELTGLEQVLTSMNLKEQSPAEYEWLFDTLGFEFKNAQNLLSQLQPPLRETLSENGAYGKLKVLAITLKSIRELVSPEIAGALGLAGGFNALDGD
jgi:hypothetical protein